MEIIGDIMTFFFYASKLMEMPTSSMVIAVIFLILLIIIGGIIFFQLSKPCKKEGFRDPLYINTCKMYKDWYPVANGSVYGPYSDIYTGHPFYDRVY